jgi:SAM-dependent methyltransferase
MPSDTPHRDALHRLAAAPHPPRPGDGPGQIPWHDPAFSERMLRVHLDATTHMASRTPDVIARHVDWLAGQLEAAGQSGPAHVVDVGCGPGLYGLELARRGHRFTGFDFAPAPLAWAREQAARDGLDATFLTADLTALPDGFAARVGPADAVTFWFGEFHTFAPEVVADFLPELAACLRPGGLFVLEFQPWDLFCQEDSTAWRAVDSSVFCDRPHLWLEEYAWDPAARTEFHVHWILETESGNLERYEQIHRAWPDADLVALLAAAGLDEPRFHPPVTGVAPEFEFPMLVARRRA